MSSRGVSGWMFLLVPAHPGRFEQRAIKRLFVCGSIVFASLCMCVSMYVCCAVSCSYFSWTFCDEWFLFVVLFCNFLLPFCSQLCRRCSTFERRPKSASTSSSTSGRRDVKVLVACVLGQDKGSEPRLRAGGRPYRCQWGSRRGGRQFCLPQLHHVKRVQFVLWSDAPYWTCLLHQWPSQQNLVTASSESYHKIQAILLLRSCSTFVCLWNVDAVIWNLLDINTQSTETLGVNWRLNCLENPMTLEHYATIAAPLICTQRTFWARCKSLIRLD